MGFPIAPWHMWGNTVNIEVSKPGPTALGVTARVQNVQVVKISYKRPETWSFFLGADIIDGDISDVNMTIIVQMNVILGVGRSTFSTVLPFPSVPAISSPQAFAEFRWAIPVGLTPVSRDPKWTTTVQTPLLDDGDPASSRTLDWLPAEDIQVAAQIGLGLDAPSAVDNRVVVACTAYFAPRTHVRPDWVAEHHQFLGSETGGT